MSPALNAWHVLHNSESNGDPIESQQRVKVEPKVKKSKRDDADAALPKRSSTNAFTRQLEVSDELSEWLGGAKSISRPELTRFFWSYVKGSLFLKPPVLLFGVLYLSPICVSRLKFYALTGWLTCREPATRSKEQAVHISGRQFAEVNWRDAVWSVRLCKIPQQAPVIASHVKLSQWNY